MEFKYLMHGLKSGATDQVLTTADQVFDEEFDMKQSEINKRQSDMSSDLDDCMTNIQNLDNTVTGVQSDIDDIHMDMNDKVDLSDFYDLKDKVDNIEVGNAIDITDLVNGEHEYIEGSIDDLGKSLLYYTSPNGKSQAYLLAGAHDIMICCPKSPAIIMDGESAQVSYTYITIRQDENKIVVDGVSDIFVGNTEFQIQGMIDDNLTLSDVKDLATTSFNEINNGGSTADKLQFEFRDHNGDVLDTIVLNGATSQQSGLMSREDKVKLDQSIPTSIDNAIYALEDASSRAPYVSISYSGTDGDVTWLPNINGGVFGYMVMKDLDVKYYNRWPGMDEYFESVGENTGRPKQVGQVCIFTNNTKKPKNAAIWNGTEFVTIPYLIDAPNDGHMYARKNGEWVAID